MSDTVTLTQEEQRARRRRNLWIAFAIAAFVVLVFLVTLSRIGATL
jgi:hypothetical protein